MTLIDRYASAIRSSDLKNKADPDDTMSTDADIVAAFGFAGHTQQYREDGSERGGRPLAVALTRLFVGDNHAAASITAILAEMALEEARRQNTFVLKPKTAESIARAVLAWYRDGACRACGGHGFELIPGAPAVSDTPCKACRGEKKRPFETEFPHQYRPVANWLLAEVEREQCMAGPEAMKKLALRL